MSRTRRLPILVWATFEQGSNAHTNMKTGKHWSAEKVANVFAPAKQTADGVAEWLAKSGIETSRHTYSTGALQEASSTEHQS